MTVEVVYKESTTVNTVLENSTTKTCFYRANIIEGILGGFTHEDL